MYQNGYLHGSSSRFSAKSAIYTTAGCQHILAICTAAVPDANSAAVCPHTSKFAIYTAAVQELNRLYTRQPGVSITLLYTRQSSRANLDIYTAAVCQHEMFIYTAVVQEPNRLYTWLPCVLLKWLFTRRYFRAKSAINMATGCLCQIKWCHTSALYAALGLQK